MKKCNFCGEEYTTKKCPQCLATNNKAFYIFSFNNNDEIEYDWFTGEDCISYDEQEMVVANFMVENDYAENYEDAIDKLESVYKQDTEVLINSLKGDK